MKPTDIQGSLLTCLSLFCNGVINEKLYSTEEWYRMVQSQATKTAELAKQEADKLQTEREEMTADFTQCENGKCGQCDGCVNAADDKYHRLKEEGLI